MNNLPSPEQLEVTLCFMLVVKSDGLLNLRVLSLDPRIIDITMSVQFRKGPEALLLAAVIDEPTGTLGEEQDQGDEDHGRDDLDPERYWVTQKKSQSATCR